MSETHGLPPGEKQDMQELQLFLVMEIAEFKLDQTKLSQLTFILLLLEIENLSLFFNISL